MIEGSFWRSDPAAALRGLGVGFLPSSTRRSFSSRKPERGMYTSPRTSISCGASAAEHPQGNGRDRAEVDGHVLADLAVAARGTACEDAGLVGEVDRETVDLRLEHVRDRGVLAEALANVLGPLLDRLVGRHLLERAHGGQVPNLLELRRRRRADPLGGRVGRHELRMLALQLHELVVGTVVRGVVDRGLVEHVVLVQPAVEQVAQLGGPRRAQAAPPGDRATTSASTSLAAEWMRPHPTPIAYRPAALAACMSKGESPT